jgi:hypothetical protein
MSKHNFSLLLFHHLFGQTTTICCFGESCSVDECPESELRRKKFVSSFTFASLHALDNGKTREAKLPVSLELRREANRKLHVGCPLKFCFNYRLRPG